MSDQPFDIGPGDPSEGFFLDIDSDGRIDTVITVDSVPDDVSTLDDVIQVEDDTQFETNTQPDDQTQPDDTTLPDDPALPDGTAQPGDGPQPVDPELPEDRSRWEGQFWQQQTENGYCAPTSIAMIVSEMRGTRLDAQQFVDQAIDLGVLNGSPGDWKGLTLDGAQQLFQSFGVSSTVVQPANASEAWEDLKTWADDSNHGIVAYIDSSEVWNSTDDDGDGLQLDHAVVVSYVDDDYVYLNDPGTPSGQQLRVPRDVFMDAWDDSGHGMVVTDDPIDMPTGQTDTVAYQPDPATDQPDLTADQPDPTGHQPRATAGPDPADAVTLMGSAATNASDNATFLSHEVSGRRLVLLPVVLAAAVVAVAATRRR
jgi:hypothetical protein